MENRAENGVDEVRFHEYWLVPGGTRGIPGKSRNRVSRSEGEGPLRSPALNLVGFSGVFEAADDPQKSHPASSAASNAWRTHHGTPKSPTGRQEHPAMKPKFLNSIFLTLAANDEAEALLANSSDGGSVDWENSGLGFPHRHRDFLQPLQRFRHGEEKQAADNAGQRAEDESQGDR